MDNPTDIDWVGEYAACTLHRRLHRDRRADAGPIRCRDGVVVDEPRSGMPTRDRRDHCVQPESGRVFATIASRQESRRGPTRCVARVAVDELEIQVCERDTDGTLVLQPEFVACVFADDCIETGEQTTNSVCRDGVG